MQCLWSKLRQHVRQLQAIKLSAIEMQPVLASSKVVSVETAVAFAWNRGTSAVGLML